MVDSVVMLPHATYREGIELVGGDVRNRESCAQPLQEQGQVEGCRSLIGKRKGCSKSWTWALLVWKGENMTEMGRRGVSLQSDFMTVFCK